MTIREEMAQEREQDAINDLADAKERIGQLEEDLAFWKGEYEEAERDLADMTALAVDYKEANTRLETEMRELLAKDDGRTREHNLLVQENRKLRKALLESNDLLRDIRLCDDDENKVAAKISDNNDILGANRTARFYNW